MKLLCLCVLGLIVSQGCGEAPRVSTQSAQREDEVKLDSDLFAPPLRVLKILIDIEPAQLQALKQSKDSHAYVRCTMHEGGETLKDVGIHCKGNPAKEFATRKPDFTITLNKFVSGQTFHGLKRLILQSSREDPSYLAAPIAFELFRQSGVPAPRCAFARLELNGHDLGLYVLNEGVNRDFLRQHFHKSKGKLYVYDEEDHTGENAQSDDDQNDDSEDAADLKPLVAAARQNDPGERWKQLERLLDMDRFLTFTALEVLLWKRDSYGYTLKAQKVRIYHDSESDRMVFFPKGAERVLEKTDGPILPDYCKGLVARAVLTTPQGQKRYHKILAKLLDTVFVPATVQARTRDLAAALRLDAVGGDAAAARAFDHAVVQFNNAVAGRASFVAEQLKTSQAK